MNVSREKRDRMNPAMWPVVGSVMRAENGAVRTVRYTCRNGSENADTIRALPNFAMYEVFYLAEPGRLNRVCTVQTWRGWCRRHNATEVKVQP